MSVCMEGCASAQCQTHSTRTKYKWKDALQRSVAAARDRPYDMDGRPLQQATLTGQWSERNASRKNLIRSSFLDHACI
jgi:hypothetical protein